jgi:hypothetical protein
MAFVYLGAWEPLVQYRPSFQLLFMVIIGDSASILIIPRRRLHLGPTHLARPAAACTGIPISVETVSLLVLIVTGAIICFLDRRAPRLCEALVDRKGEAEALALPLLKA